MKDKVMYFPPEVLEQIQPGMSLTEVAAILDPLFTANGGRSIGPSSLVPDLLRRVESDLKTSEHKVDSDHPLVKFLTTMLSILGKDMVDSEIDKKWVERIGWGKLQLETAPNYSKLRPVIVKEYKFCAQQVVEFLANINNMPAVKS